MIPVLGWSHVDKGYSNERPDKETNSYTKFDEVKGVDYGVILRLKTKTFVLFDLGITRHSIYGGISFDL